MYTKCYIKLLQHLRSKTRFNSNLGDSRRSTRADNTSVLLVARIRCCRVWTVCVACHLNVVACPLCWLYLTRLSATNYVHLPTGLAAGIQVASCISKCR